MKARQIIRKPLNGRRLVFTPALHRRLYTFTGKASYGRVRTLYKMYGAPGVIRLGSTFTTLRARKPNKDQETEE